MPHYLSLISQQSDEDITNYKLKILHIKNITNYKLYLYIKRKCEKKRNKWIERLKLAVSVSNNREKNQTLVV